MSERACIGAKLAAVALAGCDTSYYLDRRDSLTLGSGEAVETNINTHRYDPWPQFAQNTEIPTGGEIAARAVRRAMCDEEVHRTQPQQSPSPSTRDVAPRGQTGGVGAASSGGAVGPPAAPPAAAGNTIINSGSGNVQAPGAPPQGRC